MRPLLLYTSIISLYTTILPASAGTITVTSYVTVHPTITEVNTKHRCFETQLPYCHHVEFLLGTKLFGNAFTFDSMSEQFTFTALKNVITEETEIKKTGTQSGISTIEKTVHTALQVMSTAPITMAKVAGSITLMFGDVGSRSSGSSGINRAPAESENSGV
ncbi:hypothetical protein TWF788_011210 [Orbilia oligospora]|uniref:Uncharacterized protein n=1 Tax=Orbilia oligospora TaxID=2813651 RepID=A0A6G1ME80_ORBOL|nr:hypothetical protein TWF788_011210 [Orbilia oligospora]KAF3228520.1 hypothetical protein TWF191_002376 [Orbilia oligospora]KAF3252974.1 hypothetical protein TWF192_004259 [Orbilia oligospora]